MPVVGRGDHDGVDVLAIEYLAKVVINLGLAPGRRLARRACGSYTSQTAATRTSGKPLKVFSRPLPMPPTPMKPSTIDSLAGAGPLGFSFSSSASPRQAPSPGQASRPQCRGRQHSPVASTFPSSGSPIGLISVNISLVTETRADLKNPAAWPGCPDSAIPAHRRVDLPCVSVDAALQVQNAGQPRSASHSATLRERIPWWQ